MLLHPFGLLAVGLVCGYSVFCALHAPKNTERRNHFSLVCPLARRVSRYDPARPATQRLSIWGAVSLLVVSNPRGGERTFRVRALLSQKRRGGEGTAIWLPTNLAHVPHAPCVIFHPADDAVLSKSLYHLVTRYDVNYLVYLSEMRPYTVPLVVLSEPIPSFRSWCSSCWSGVQTADTRCCID